MKISFLKIALSKLKNELHVQFHDFMIILIIEIGAIALGIQELFGFYRAAFSREQEALDYIRQSELTKKIADQDHVRNEICRGFSNTVKGARDHYEVGYRVSANTVWALFLFYGSLPRRNYAEETAAIDDLLRELAKSENNDAIERLGFRGWVESLVQENTVFKDLYMQRVQETSEKTPYRMAITRKETDEYFYAILAELKNKILKGQLPTNPKLKVFIDKANILITQFKTILAKEYEEKNQEKKPSGEKVIEVEKLEDNKYKIKEGKA